MDGKVVLVVVVVRTGELGARLVEAFCGPAQVGQHGTVSVQALVLPLGVEHMQQLTDAKAALFAYEPEPLLTELDVVEAHEAMLRLVPWGDRPVRVLTVSADASAPGADTIASGARLMRAELSVLSSPADIHEAVRAVLGDWRPHIKHTKMRKVTSMCVVE